MALLLALLLLQPAAPADAERLFALGTRLVAEGDTVGAVAAWEGATATGWTSAAVEHNLGTVALARGDVGRARLHLERAVRLAPGDPAVARNAALARERAGAAPPSVLHRVWTRVVAIAGLGGLVALALGLVYGALGLVALGRRRVGGALGALALLAVGAAGAALWERSRPTGVVLVREADVREAPAATAAGVARVRAGDLVDVGAAEGGWRRVTADGEAGWLRAEAVERL